MTVANKDTLPAVKIKRELRVNVSTNGQLDLGPNRRYIQHQQRVLLLSPVPPMTAANDITVPTFKMKRELRSVVTNCVPLDLMDRKIDLLNFLPLMTSSKELYNSPGLELTQNFPYPKIDLHTTRLYHK